MSPETNKNFVINRMTPNHLEEIIRLEIECGLSPWGLDSYRKEIERVGGSICLVALTQDIAIGFIILRLNTDEEGEILNFGVKKNWRQTGIGTKLLRKAISQAIFENNTRRIWLEVRESNQTAIGLYQKNGFVTLGMRKNYYTDPPENAILMELKAGSGKGSEA